MSGSRAISLYTLRVVVAAMCAWGAFSLLRAVSAGHGPHLPHLVLQVIAIAEVVAALLFLLPTRLGRLGGQSLLVILLAATAIHLLHGDHSVWNLVLYAAAVWAVLSNECRTSAA